MRALIVLINLFFCLNIYAVNISILDIKTEKGASIYSGLIKDETNIRAVFVGDVLLSRFVKNSVDANGGDYKFLFEKIEPFLRGADIVFGNLENPVTEKKFNIRENIIPIIQTPVQGALSIANVCCKFGAEVSSLDALKWAGFNVVSISNNHTGDAGLEGIEDTVANLNKMGINYVGGGLNSREAHTPYIFEKNGIKTGILAYSNVKKSSVWHSTEVQPGIAIFDDLIVKKDIQLVRPFVDILVVSMHNGDENDISPDSEEIESAHYMIDNGVDMIVGHHPHIIQPLEIYHGGLISYSLGNFVFDSDSYEHTNGLLMEIFIKEKSDIFVIPREVIMNYAHQPSIKQQY
jgi:poly-gamma-glutamate synthesis protein (capsule biosynthesis protein)